MKKIKKLVRFIITPLAYVLGGLFFLPFLYLLEWIRPVRIGVLFYNRIGHLAINTEIFCRRVQLGILPKNYFYLFLSATPANQQLQEMYKRELHIVDQVWLFRLATFFMPLLQKTRFHQEIPVKCNEYYEFAHGKAVLTFTAAEEEKGQAELRKMGVPKDAWFVLIHARDPLYMKEKILAHQDDQNQAWNQGYNYRDCKIENYLSAAEYITEQGGFVIRMGDVVDAPLSTSNPKIIDYATRFRSDFMDIYLSAKCKFFLGCTSGLCMVPTIFDVPVALANYIPYPHTPFSIQDLFITKFIVEQKTGKTLSYEEAMQQGLMGWEGDTLFYQQKGLTIVENSAQDILHLCQEMNEELNRRGRSKENVPHSLQQSLYKKKFLPQIFDASIPVELSARIANSFLKNHSHMMGNK